MSSADTQRRHLSNFAQYPTSLRSNITRAVVAFVTPLSDREDPRMDILGESLLVILVVGIIAGWLAGQFVGGTGLGLLGDLIVGIAGAFITSWIFPQVGIYLGSGIVSEIVDATIGAVLLLLIVRVVRGRSRWGGRWGGA